ncbi:MAG: hypothetical protein JWN18_150 [Parcubacteria group bacterium]|nr:hypothetical protein [Parcubacteria group bacterium]
MHLTRDDRFERTDIWKEGKWLDLWSVVHFLSGVSIGFVFYLFPFGQLASVIIVFLSLTAYEMWEKIVGIEETPANRVLDVVVGMASFLPTFLLFAPSLSFTLYILVFGLILTANIVMSVFGWIASQKAAALKVRASARYLKQRARLLQRAERLRVRMKSKDI